MTAKKSATVEAVVVESSELVITKMQPGLAIESNFDAVRAHIESIVADYQGLVVTQDYVGQAKKDRAYLNSLATSLTQRFREVKRAYMAPVEKLDMQIKELEFPIKEASAAIDVQVKAFEEREKAVKRAELVKHWTEYAGILADVVPFERIESASWANKTCDLMTAFGDIEHIVERIAKEEATLDSLGLSHPVEAKAAYLETLDMAAAIARSKALDAQEENVRRFEAEKAEIAAAAEPETPAEIIAAIAEGESCPDSLDELEADEAFVDALDAAIVAAGAVLLEQPRERTFTVNATQAQVDGIIAYLRSVGLTGTVSR